MDVRRQTPDWQVCSPFNNGEPQKRFRFESISRMLLTTVIGFQPCTGSMCVLWYKSGNGRICKPEELSRTFLTTLPLVFFCPEKSWQMEEDAGPSVDGGEMSNIKKYPRSPGVIVLILNWKCQQMAFCCPCFQEFVFRCPVRIPHPMYWWWEMTYNPECHTKLVSLVCRWQVTVYEWNNTKRVQKSRFGWIGLRLQIHLFRFNNDYH